VGRCGRYGDFGGERGDGCSGVVGVCTCTWERRRGGVAEVDWCRGQGDVGGV
jgi:hypothetical protein